MQAQLKLGVRLFFFLDGEVVQSVSGRVQGAGDLHVVSSEFAGHVLVSETINFVLHYQNVVSAHIAHAMESTALGVGGSLDFFLDHPVVRVAVGMDVVGALAVLNGAVQRYGVVLAECAGRQKYYRNQ